MDVFVSFNPDSEHDRLTAAALSDLLRQNDIRPVSVNLRSTYGDDGVIEGLLQFPYCVDFFVILLSDGYCQSDWHHRELAAFLAYENMKRRTNMIVPAVLEDGVRHWLLKRIKPVCDFEKQPLDQAAKQLIEHLHGTRRPKPTVFVVMPFGSPEVDVAYTAMERAIHDAGYDPIRIDKEGKPGYVPLQIIQQIDDCDIVLADLTLERPNCYFEAGYAQGVGKEIIYSIFQPKAAAAPGKTGDKIHFDLAGHNFIQWSDPFVLLEALTKRFTAIKERERLQRRHVEEGKPVPIDELRSRRPLPADGADSKHWKSPDEDPVTAALARGPKPPP